MVLTLSGKKVSDPLNKKIPLEIKKELYKDLKKGLCVFLIPGDFSKIKVDQKRHRKNYKVGFLYDLLTNIYPEENKAGKHDIIADKFHFDFSYRQFKTILDEYEENRKKYLFKPISL